LTIWSKRLAIVVGKGGVGRTTTAVALAIAAAREGKRVVVVELYGLAAVPAAYELPDRSYQAREVAAGVDTMSLTPGECMNEYGRRKLRVGALVRLVFGNRVMGSFIDAVPGMHDLLQLGKIEHLVLTGEVDGQGYDLVVVDAPATGHGLTLLAATRSMMEMTRVGPFHDLAASIDELIRDPARTALVLATLPEEMPVNETLDFLDSLGADQGLVELLVINQIRRSPLPPSPTWDQAREALATSAVVDHQELVRLGDRVERRLSLQKLSIERLIEGAERRTGRTVPRVTLPRIGGGIGAESLATLGGRLHRQLLEDA